MRITATYILQSPDLEGASQAIAIGQSIGNPTRRSRLETKEMWERCAGRVESQEKQTANTAIVKVSFPIGNFTPGSLVHLLTTLMGGQMDIDIVQSCKLIDIDLPQKYVVNFPGPKFGIAGIHKKLNLKKSRPLVGCIVKPKTGLTPTQMADVCQEMADGGGDFIKEDEIQGDIETSQFARRVEEVVKRLEPYNIIYAPCIATHSKGLRDQIAILNSINANSFHVNFWAGLDAFLEATHLNKNLFAYYQKSGDRVVTSGPYSIDSAVWNRLIRLSGADFTHVGMLGGYLDEGVAVLNDRLAALCGSYYHLRPVLPSFSCGATPESVAGIKNTFGNDIMISSGGYINEHPKGVRFAVKEFRDAVEV